MVGRDAEWSGIIRAGAKMVNAVSNSVVPKIAVIMGGSFGAGHYAMCGKAYDPRFLFAWPTARYAVMAGDSAAGTLVEIKIKQLERGGKKLSDEDKKKLYDEVKRHLRRADRSALRRRAAVDRQDHRSGGDARCDHAGAGGSGAESRRGRVQGGSAADVRINADHKTGMSLDGC
jgi:acetyl-CoA carboxylase carboxyltransferase component